MIRLIGILGILAVVVGLVVVLRARLNRTPAGRCPECGHALPNIASPRCPACGESI